MVLNEVAVTGASGMLGRHIVAFLAHRGIASRALTRRRPEGLPLSCSWSPLDLSAPSAEHEWNRLWGRPQTLILSGAYVPSSTTALDETAILDINVKSTLALGRWAARNQIHVIYISGSTVYARPEAPRINEDAPLALCGNFGGFYGLSKLLGEQVLGFFAREYGLALAILRPSSLYGTGLPENKLLPSWLVRATRGETLQVAPPGFEQVNLVHAADLARAIWLVGEKRLSGCWNVRGANVSMREVAQICVNVAGAGQVEFSPEDDPAVNGCRFDLDGSRAEKDFGYSPSVSLEHGLTLLQRKALLPSDNDAVIPES